MHDLLPSIDCSLESFFALLDYVVLTYSILVKLAIKNPHLKIYGTLFSSVLSVALPHTWYFVFLCFSSALTTVPLMDRYINEKVQVAGGRGGAGGVTKYLYLQETSVGNGAAR